MFKNPDQDLDKSQAISVNFGDSKLVTFKLKTDTQTHEGHYVNRNCGPKYGNKNINYGSSMAIYDNILWLKNVTILFIDTSIVI